MRKDNTAALRGLAQMMIKKAALMVGAAAFIAAAIVPGDYVRAETRTGSDKWSVTFTKDKEMDSTFKTSDLDEVIYGMQPGDEAKLTMKLSNENEATTDWYMTNKVINSLEDTSKDKETAGGAYTYILTYTNPDGEVRELFNSETVGGDDKSPAGEGLKEATDALKDYFYLDTLATGKAGQIDLTVGLDGETQGNDYQDTLADLQMNFAVELSDDSTATTSTSTSTTTTSTSTTTTTTTRTTTRTTIVKTGDENRILPYVLIAGAGGLFLLFFTIFCVLGRRKRREEG